MGLALITGASSGLGLELARIFVEDNHSVILVARRRDRLEALAKELRAKRPAPRVDIISMDLGIPGAGDKLFREIEKLGVEVDFLVNNAGFGSVGTVHAIPIERQLQMVDLNIRTLVELTGLVLPSMLHRRSGRILNVGSVAGFQPGPYMAAYYASKAFVNSFTEALHEELRDTGVSCTLLAPGPTETEFGVSAGMTSSALFRWPSMVAGAGPTAAAGYRAMMQGRALVVPGASNKTLVQMTRVTPRSLARRVAGMLNKNK